MSSPLYHLYYFDKQGLAEPIRYILSYGVGERWEDHRFPYSCISMIEEIPEEFRSRWRSKSFPLLEFEGRHLSQPATIGRFLATRFNLTGKDEFESAQCDEIVDSLNDFCTLMCTVLQTENLERPIMIANVIPAAKERFLSKFNQIIKANGGHVVGSRLTWADIWVAHHVSTVEGLLQIKLTDSFPALRTLIKTTFDEPSLREWRLRRPYTLS